MRVSRVLQHTAALSFVDKRGVTPNSHLLLEAPCAPRSPTPTAGSRDEPDQAPRLGPRCEINPSLLRRPSRRVAHHEEAPARMVSPPWLWRDAAVMTQSGHRLERSPPTAAPVGRDILAAAHECDLPGP